MASKYYDTSAIAQVIGCMYKNIELFDNENYVITENDFVNSFHKVVFGILYNLSNNGAKEFTPELISDFLENHPQTKGVFNSNKGFEYLIQVKENANLLTFDYYYNRIKKMSLLRAYDDLGISVTDIYDPDNVLDLSLRQKQEEKLDNLSLEEIANHINDKFSEVYQTYVQNDVFGESIQAGDGLEELIKEFEQRPDIGVPLYGNYINTVLRGARLGKFYLRSAATGVGKAIPNYTLIPTPDGWRKVGDIKVGDYLFGQDGKPTKVIATYPQPNNKEIWKVTFSDGRVAECCGEHLWEYSYESHRGRNYRIENIQTIYNRSLLLKNGLKDSCGKGFRFHIKLNEPVNYPSKNYKLSPYVMGALLGDGSFRYNKDNKILYYSSQDEELPNKIVQELGEGYSYKRNSDKNYNWTLRKDGHPLWVEKILEDYPELWNLKSEDKFIPNDYLFGSIEQRFELLRGLMDTDGSIDSQGRLNFTTVSPKLRDSFIELCRTLGFIATYTVDKRTRKYTTGECYCVHIQCKKEIKLKIFSLNRKVQIAKQYVSTNKRNECKDSLAIINIEKTNQKTAMTCFTVDNDSHLFLMNDFIVTHNTRSMIADACYISCEKIYDENFGWIKTSGKQFPTLFIGTEQEKSEIQSLILAFVSNVNEDHITTGKYEEGERERVFEAARIIKNAPLYIEELPEFNLQDVENTIKRNIREHDIRYFFHDYIHSSLKILAEITKQAGHITLREDQVLFMLSARLKEICVKNDVFIMSATQLNAAYQDSDTPDQNLLRGAKSIADWTNLKIYTMIIFILDVGTIQHLI